MDHLHEIDGEEYKKRLVNLFLRSGLWGFPNDGLNRQVLLRSAIVGLDPDVSYSEHEINDKLKAWVERVGSILGIDHVTMRRYLVDYRYLVRQADGSCYQLGDMKGIPYRFKPEIDTIDIPELLHAARLEIENRKQAHVQSDPDPKQ